ncbi:hypothetical protein [Hymenobacter weizhouensis]|uniref:hypothetical protein n=1 Tax=Hymenobacter sp. YIM 151500-1 TaxID=2987689 RepID=UPI002225D4A5|nr:hypothetical protein [Hymenobacter sp. YIM 151500-1]UYZ63617.1 hypothetical protein OIS53_01940 [Hymenobacter sp. YIM 151500-1]
MSTLRWGWAGIAGLGWLLAACAPSYYLKPAPGQATDPSSFSTNVGLAEADSLEVRLQFIGYEKTAIIFSADIRNGSDRPVQVAPETFCYLPTLPRPAVASAAPGTSGPKPYVLALNPEVQLQNLEARLDRHARKASGVSFFELLTVATHVAEDVSSIKKKETDQQIAEREDRHAQNNQYFDEQRADHADQAAALYQEHHSKQHQLLRRREVGPGERLTGFVYFPRTDVASHLRVVVYLRERPFVFDFNQAKVKQ